MREMRAMCLLASAFGNYRIRSDSKILRPLSMKHSTIKASIDSEMEIPFDFMAADILLNCLFIRGRHKNGLVQ
jgi:hypothetical protein